MTQSLMPLLLLLLLLLQSVFKISSATRSISNTELCGSDAAWHYQPISSKCYSLHSYQPGNYSSAAAHCVAVGAAASGAAVATLPQLVTDADITAFQLYLHGIALEDYVWVGAVRSGSSFTWTSDSSTVPDSLFLTAPPPAGSGSDCAVYHSELFTTTAAGWSRNRGLLSSECGTGRLVICERRVVNCNPASITNYNSNSMSLTNITSSVLYSDQFHIGLSQSVSCKPGFFRSRDSPLSTEAAPAASADGLEANTAICDYSVAAAGDVTVVIRQGVIEECFPIRCKTNLLLTTFLIPKVQPYAAQLTSSYLNYSQAFTVQCLPGYVSYVNDTQVQSDVTCGQSSIDRTVGEWMPADLNTCKPVKCPDINTITDITKVTAYKAVNRIDEKQFTEFQSSSFPYFPNRVHLKCKQDGYFFDDREYEKLVSCELKNATLIAAEWVGSLGTKVADLATANCIEVSCRTDELIPKTADGQKALEALNYQSLAHIHHPNGSIQVTNASSVNSQELLPYRTVIEFRCLTGMETGIGLPVALCLNNGFWNTSLLPTCTKISDQLQTKGKFYVPPAVEAQAAGSVGALAVTLSVIFGICIVLLDVSTLSRDIGVMRRNLRLLKKRLRLRRETKLRQMQ